MRESPKNMIDSLWFAVDLTNSQDIRIVYLKWKCKIKIHNWGLNLMWGCFFFDVVGILDDAGLLLNSSSSYILYAVHFIHVNRHWFIYIHDQHIIPISIFFSSKVRILHFYIISSWWLMWNWCAWRNITHPEMRVPSTLTSS